jgi:hypothetical protein
VSWFRFRSIEEGRPRVVCRACGHSNVHHPTFRYRACARCFHDPQTGARHFEQVLPAVMLLVCAYFLCAMLGMFLALVFIQLPLDIAFGLELPEAHTKRQWVVAAVSLLGSAAGLWVVAHRRGKAGGQAQIPPGASVRKRVDQRVGRVVAGAVLAFSVAWTVENALEEGGAADWVIVSAFVVLVCLGALAGNAYDLHQRGRGGR